MKQLPGLKKLTQEELDVYAKQMELSRWVAEMMWSGHAKGTEFTVEDYIQVSYEECLLCWTRVYDYLKDEFGGVESVKQFLRENPHACAMDWMMDKLQELVAVYRSLP